MNDLVIRVEGLSKQYRLGVKQEKYRTLRDTIADTALAPVRAVKSLASRNGHRQGGPEHFWALNDVSFELNRGEVLGVIGRNGSGKSTLLKILSRITEPTKGFAEIRGRVGSLLEVGTGFHPELSGRENIYLNGAILGMRRTEIDRKFDEIVEFAEVEKFIDTPVKHYSSGMYLRLAFAVAAHLEPEILIVDEVLAVGDAAFQQKCIGKMEDVAKEGRTVLFVSHNMEAVLSLCSRCIVLSEGSVIYKGPADEAVTCYHKGSFGSGSEYEPHVLYADPSPSYEGATRVLNVAMHDLDGAPKPMLSTWDDLCLRITYAAVNEIRAGSIICEIRDFKGQRLIVLDSGLHMPILEGRHTVECVVPQFPLAAGEYYLGMGIARSRNEWLWRDTGLAVLRVHGQDVYDLNRPPTYSRMMFAAAHRWVTPTQADAPALHSSHR